MASALVYPMKLVMSPEYRKAFPCVTRWFTTCVNQPQFKAVIGVVELAKEEMTAEGAPAAPKKEKVSFQLCTQAELEVGEILGTTTCLQGKTCTARNSSLRLKGSTERQEGKSKSSKGPSTHGVECS